MPTWLLIIILSSIFLFLLIAISGAIIFTATLRIKKATMERDEALKMAHNAKQKLETYGFKEIDIHE